MLGGGGRVGSAWYELELRDEGFLGQLQNAGQQGAGALNPAVDAASGLGDALDTAGQKGSVGLVGRLKGGLSDLAGGLKEGVSAGIGLGGAMGVAGVAMMGVNVAINTVGQAVSLASDKVEAASKVNALFGDSAGIIEERSKTAADTVALSSGAYLTLAGDLGNLITNMGITGDEAANMSGDMISLAADMGSFNNASTTEVTEAMGAAFRGETEPIRRFGVMLDQAAISAKAVEMGLAAEGEELSKAARAQATYALILEQTTAAQGDLARTADGMANAQRLAAARQEEAMTKLGDVLMPVVQLLQGAFSTAMTAVIELITGVATVVGDWIGQMQPLFEIISDVVNDGLKILLGVLEDVAGFISGPVNMALGLLGDLFGIVGDAIGFFGDMLGGAVDHLHNLHRTLDPAMAALEDARTDFGELGKQAGLTAEEIDAAWARALEGAAPYSLDTREELQGAIDKYKETEESSRVQANAAELNAERAAGAAERIGESADYMAERFASAADRIPAETQIALDDAARQAELFPGEMASAAEEAMPDAAKRIARSLVVETHQSFMAAENVRRLRELGAMPPEAIADGIQDNTHALMDAADALIDALKNRLSPEEQRLRMIGKKYTTAVAQGVRSGDKDLIDASISIAVSAINTIEARSPRDRQLLRFAARRWTVSR
jgi:hypothetical protein